MYRCILFVLPVYISTSKKNLQKKCIQTIRKFTHKYFAHFRPFLHSRIFCLCIYVSFSKSFTKYIDITTHEYLLRKAHYCTVLKIKYKFLNFFLNFFPVSCYLEPGFLKMFKSLYKYNVNPYLSSNFVTLVCSKLYCSVCPKS